MRVYLIALAVISSLAGSFQYKVIDRPPLRIVNGTTAAEGEFPYLVELRESDGFFTCTGGILGEKWILTAGHCVDDDSITSAVYGTTKLYDWGDGFPNTSVNVINRYQHPNYTESPIGIPIYDVGLLELEHPIPLGDIAQAIKLTESSEDIPFHVLGVLAGWGVNDTWGESPPYLQKINLQLLNDQECVDKINGYSGDDSFLPVHHLCSDDYYNGECFGDSGSPFVVNGTTYGVVSWSYKPCGIVPGTYSRLSNPIYREWIRSVTNI